MQRSMYDGKVMVSWGVAGGVMDRKGSINFPSSYSGASLTCPVTLLGPQV